MGFGFGVRVRVSPLGMDLRVGSDTHLHEKA